MMKNRLEIFSGFDVSKIGDKSIHRVECDLKVFWTDVKIEKAVITGVEIDEIAGIAFAPHSFGKVFDQIVGCNGITFAMDHQARGEFSSNREIGVVSGGLFGVGKPFHVDAALVRANDGADANHSLWSRMDTVDLQEQIGRASCRERV